MIIAMLTVVGAWILAFCVIAGLGQFVRKAFGISTSDASGWFYAFWLGYAIGIAALECWHLFLPIDWRIDAILGVVGLIGFIWGLRQPGKVKFPKVRVAFFFLALIPIALWIVSRALDAQLDFDTGMYHLSTIHWLNAYPVVPGLGNLHYRLAFNQSFFMFVSALNIYPVFDQGMHVANSLLMIVLLSQLVNATLITLFARRRSPQTLQIGLLNALFVPVVIYRATHQYDSANMSSASPDLSIFILQIVVILAFINYLLMRRAPDNERKFLLFFLIAVSAVGVTSKLSFSMFGVVIVGLILVIWLWTRRQRLIPATGQAALWLIIVGGCLGLPWMINGVISSGYPLFPSTVGALPVDYRVPAAIATDAADWVRSFARDPHGDTKVVLSTWTWLPTWQYLMRDSFDQFLFAIPLRLFGIAIGVYALLFLIVQVALRRPYRYRLWLPLIPAFLSAAFWFWSAPDPRFAGSAFWILALWGLVLIFTLFPNILARWLIYPAMLLPIGVAGLLLVQGLNADFSLDGNGFPPLPHQTITRFQTDSGLLVNVSGNPSDTLELWDAPLPASPYRLPLLELRGTDLKDGFRMRSDP